MTPKNKSFFEDTLILIVVGIIIYSIYYFFFIKKDDSISLKTEPIIEKKIENVEKNETTIADIKKAKALIENKDLKDLEQENNNLSDSINQELKIENKSTEKITEETLDIKIDKKEEKTKEKFTDIKSFYKNIENKINENIKKNITESNTSNKSVNIRVTILKDGRYEQLTFMGGDKKYFNKIKSSIKEIFPLKIDKEIENNFPRYFRMKVE